MSASENAIEASHLTFSFGGPSTILKDISLAIPKGSRTLLVGANGAGKSTLLTVLAGKRLVRNSGVKVLGKDPFNDGSQGITYLGTEWALNPIVRRDVPVSRILKTLGAERHPDRCSSLLEIMDVDPDWHMHEVSDGQRRRVQIVLGLMEPWDLLLLDEVTVDLDVLVRANLLRFLKEETETRNATIVYATHIFDGLSSWPTHVAHVADGAIDVVRDLRTPGGFPELEIMKNRRGDVHSSDNAVLDNSPLLMVVESWLREDHRRLKKEGRRNHEGKVLTKWEILSENMKEFGDKYYNYWR
ncbi:CCR4-NOT regulatory complex component [Gaertneriomyces sp. JEL0708]|nr:CCR4-NOT regulatory complex component [Gaertneriomyces sp. JEL0708]